MAKTCSANYVDRLLIKIDGAICPIWNSIFYTFEEPPAPFESVFACINSLINEAPRLKSVWSSQGKGWLEIKPSEQQRASTLVWDDCPKDKIDRQQLLIRAPIDLGRSLPFRISIGKIVNVEGQKWLIGFQLHHAAGDGRALGHLIQRFWDLLNHYLHNQPLKLTSLAAPHMTDKKFIHHCLKNKKTLKYIVNAKYRQLSRRGDALAHDSSKIGQPYLNTIAINLANLNYHHSSELFHAAILAAVMQSTSKVENQLIRLRIPLDLRGLWGVPKNSIENGSAAVMIELPLQLIQDTFTNNPKQLGLLVNSALKQLLKKRTYLCTSLECILISHLSSAKKIKPAIRDELLASKRSSTLVITHFGDATVFFKPPPSVKVLSIESHTPVWGANSFVYDGSLYINNTCFDGIWSHEQMEQFSNHAKNWLLTHYSSPEVIS